MMKSIVKAILLIGGALAGLGPARADCIAHGAAGQKEIVTYAAGPELTGATNFFPSGGDGELGLRAPFDPKAFYFGRLEAELNKQGVGASFQPIEQHSLTLSRIPDDHPLVKRGRVDKGDTLVTLDIPSDLTTFVWERTRIYIYACPTQDGGSPASVSSAVIRVSPTSFSIVLAIVIVALAYVLCALSAKAIDPVQNHRVWRYLDPVYMTAGTDGKGSLSKLQILFFSTIVFGLLTYIWLRTGRLSDLSATILTLLGIAAVGSTTAKATDVQKNRISTKNATWFLQKRWLPATGLSAINEARWRDVVGSDGEFDVYRYQNLIFSLVVGLSLLFVGVTQLASFTIPDTLLEVLGLSQVVYVAGKLVMPTSVSDLNDSTDAIRALDDDFYDVACRTADPTPPAGTDANDPPATLDAAKRRAGKDKYNAYKKAVEDLRVEFTSAIGRAPPAGAEMEPRFRA